MFTWSSVLTMLAGAISAMVESLGGESAHSSTFHASAGFQGLGKTLLSSLEQESCPGAPRLLCGCPDLWRARAAPRSHQSRCGDAGETDAYCLMRLPDTCQHAWVALAGCALTGTHMRACRASAAY